MRLIDCINHPQKNDNSLFYAVFLLEVLNQFTMKHFLVCYRLCSVTLYTPSGKSQFATMDGIQNDIKSKIYESVSPVYKHSRRQVIKLEYSLKLKIKHND